MLCCPMLFQARPIDALHRPSIYIGRILHSSTVSVGLTQARPNIIKRRLFEGGVYSSKIRYKVVTEVTLKLYSGNGSRTNAQGRKYHNYSVHEELNSNICQCK